MRNIRKIVLPILVILILIQQSSIILADTNFPDLSIQSEFKQPTGEKFNATVNNLAEQLWVKAESGEIIIKGSGDFWYYAVKELNTVKASTAKYKIDKMPKNFINEKDYLALIKQNYTDSVKGIEINKNKVDMLTGQNEILSVTLEVSTAESNERLVTWESSNESVTITNIYQSGKYITIKGIKPGKSTIRASFSDKPELHAECDVEVMAPLNSIMKDNRLGESVVLFQGSPNVFINGKELVIDAYDLAKTVTNINGKMYVPIEFIVKAFNADIKKDEGNQEVFIIKVNDKTIESSTINYQSVYGELYIPLREFVDKTLKKSIFFHKGLVIISDKLDILDKIQDEAKINALIKYISEGINQDTPIFRVGLEGKCGFIDKYGRVVIEPNFTDARNFSEGLAAVAQDGKYGFINKNGEMIIKPEYDMVWNFCEGMARFEIEKKCGFIDKKGNVVVKPMYSSGLTSDFHEGLSSVLDESSGKFGYIDKKGEFAIKPAYKMCGIFSDNLAAVRDSETGKCGYIDKTGEYVIQPQYANAFEFSDGVASVTLDMKYGFVDKTGELVVKPAYGFAYKFSNGLAVVEAERFGTGKYGFIDKSGKYVIEPKFSKAYNFSEGLAAVEILQDDKKTSKWGFIDEDGEFIIPAQYEGALSFENGLANVFEFKGMKQGYVNAKGEVVWEPSKY